MVFSFCRCIGDRIIFLAVLGNWCNLWLFLILKKFPEFIVVEGQDKTYTGFYYLGLYNRLVLILPVNPDHIPAILAQAVIDADITGDVSRILIRIRFFQ